jgi:hypothetical protein
MNFRGILQVHTLATKFDLVVSPEDEEAYVKTEED